MKRPKAGDTMLGAARVRAEERGGPSGYADRQEATVRARVEAPVRTVGGELVPEDDFMREVMPALVDTLANPDAIGAEASRCRLELLAQTGAQALPLALDNADTIEAADSLERGLAHQLAVAHTMAMRTAVVLGHQLESAERHLDPAKKAAACVEVNRLAGAFDRLTKNYQSGMLTLRQMRSGGKQVIVVQNNRVEPGGQAVIGGQQQVGGGGRRRAGGTRGPTSK